MCASIIQGIDQSLEEISKRLKKVFNCEAMALSQATHVPHRSAADGGLKPLFHALKAVDRISSFIVELPKRDELARPGFTSACSTNFGPRQSRTRAFFDSRAVPMGDTAWSAVPTFSGAKDFSNYPGRY